jgi:hypothetical protein
MKLTAARAVVLRDPPSGAHRGAERADRVGPTPDGLQNEPKCRDLFESQRAQSALTGNAASVGPNGVASGAAVSRTPN